MLPTDAVLEKSMTKVQPIEDLILASTYQLGAAFVDFSNISLTFLECLPFLVWNNRNSETQNKHSLQTGIFT